MNVCVYIPVIMIVTFIYDVNRLVALDFITWSVH